MITESRYANTITGANGRKIIKLRGGRPTSVIKDRSRYSRKEKYKNQYSNQINE